MAQDFLRIYVKALTMDNKENKKQEQLPVDVDKQQEKGTTEETYIANAHASGDGSLKRSDEESNKLSEEGANNLVEDY